MGTESPMTSRALHRNFARAGAAAAAAALLIPAVALAQRSEKTALRRLHLRELDLTNPNGILAVDLVGDDTPEAVVTDAKGQLRVLDGATLEVLGALSVPGDVPLSPPGAGDFAGRDRIDLAVGTSSGTVLFIEGTSSRLLAQYVVEGVEFNEQPTAAPVRAELLGKVVERFDPLSADLDLCVIADSRGTLHALRLVEAAEDAETPFKVEVVWKEDCNTQFSGPAVMGFPRFKDKPDLVASSRSGLLIIADPFTGKRENINVKERKRIIGSPLLADMTANGLDEMVVAFDEGETVVAAYNPANPRRIEELHTEPINAVPIHGPMLALPTGSSSPLLLVIPGRNRLVVKDARNLSDLAVTDEQVLSPKNGEIALLARPGGAGQDSLPELALGVGQTVTVTNNFGEWYTRDGATLLKLEEGSLGNETVMGALAVYTDRESGKARILAATSGGDATLWQSEVRTVTPWPVRTIWATSGGSMWHNARADFGQAALLRERGERLRKVRDGKLEEVRAASEAGDWQRALKAADWLRDFDPRDSEYSSLRQRTVLRKNLLGIVLGLAGGLAIGGYVVLLGGRVFLRRSRFAKASQLRAQGKLAEARAAYEDLLRRYPSEAGVAVPLAGIYLALADFSAETRVVYRAAHKAKPDDPALLHGMVRSLLLEPVVDADAEAAYARALETFPEPELLEYGLGMCAMAKKDYEGAAKRLRAALRNGLATDRVYAALCDVYLATNNTSAKAHPVYQHEFARRSDDQRFLEAYLESCIDARATDGEIESLCYQVLDGNPAFSPAYCHLCAIKLQKNEIGPAIDEVRNALKHNPDDPSAVALLAHCFLLGGRRDDEAVQAFKRALKQQPGDRELLRTLTEILHDRGVYDAEAVEIYTRSHAENPDDPATLRAVAQTAVLKSDHALSVRALEALAQQGQMNPKLTRQLALSYVRLGSAEPRAERALREGLRLDPNNTEILGALSKVLMAQDRSDSEALPVYESLLAADPSDSKVGRQMARGLLAQSRHDEALALLQRLLAAAPGDDELKRLQAQASLHGNRIDEAIGEYERILRANPKDQDALANLASAYAQKRRSDDEALALYERAIPGASRPLPLHLAAARCHAKKDDQLRAIEAYQRALQCGEGADSAVLAHAREVLHDQPGALRLRWLVVEILIATNRLREAMEELLVIFDGNPGQAKNVLSALDKVLSKDPNNILALTQKGRMLTSSGESKLARRTLEKAYQLQPTNAEVQKSLTTAYEALLKEKDDHEVRFNLGRTFYQMGEFDKAIGSFQRTAQDYRWEAESAKALGKCFTAKGMLDLALQEYKKLVVDEETKELLYDLAQRYEAKKDLVGAKQVYRQLFAADINYKDVQRRFELLSGSTSDPAAFERTSIVQEMSEEAARRYELLDELGRGAMGIVYRARDKELEEVVALKILPDGLSNNPEAVRRFKIEARNARKLSHPYIVRIHDIGEEMGRKYISMEYVDGSDLKKRAKTGDKLTVKEILHYSEQIADALAYAHRLGIVHRDIKPANIMLTSGNDVKITDFGIAKLMDQTTDGTMVGAVIGTPLYMSPEQVQGIPVDNRADIYSFGIMLYEFVNGRPPFTEGDLTYQHIHREPDPIQGCDPRLWQVIAKCLAKKKEDRWQRAEDLTAAIRELRRAMA
ncbi:MAG: protein kinase [Candidatus Sumerlaeia bacterium]|nr:protein kinase [Candidatus Sumerlaeia bacterium]